ncbi:acyl-CoA reductase [Flavobacterium sp.]|uniref:acyl-CoA reductase n=1 Tax=Flavobacterium sp. TaxID=239 RepID=UPI0033401970
MLQIEIKNNFVELGKFLSQFSLENNQQNEQVKYNDLFFNSFVDLIALSQSHNNWFTPDNVHFSISSWSEALTENNLNQWLSAYNFIEKEPKNVGLILAGNIPLVGFHDFLSVLISGNNVLVKTSSKDDYIIKFLANYLIALDTRFNEKITFVEGKLKNFDAVIATGSNNTARYFEYYFKNKPSIIRKSRNSVAVLTGNETPEEMTLLSEDVFRYFGLGCRNVSKIFVPKNYNFDAFFNGMYAQKDVIYYEKYANNYDYNKAVFLMSNFQLLDNEFLTIKEDTSHASPISSVFYEYYEDINEVKTRIQQDAEIIQCVVSNGIIENSVYFGNTQKPNLWDYADNVDTLDFLNNL